MLEPLPLNVALPPTFHPIIVEWERVNQFARLGLYACLVVNPLHVIKGLTTRDEYGAVYLATVFEQWLVSPVI